MIKTYTPADLPTLALPGSLPGLLPRWKDAPAVWTGPVEIIGAHPLRPGDWTVTAYGDGGMANGADLSRLRLPLSRPEARYRVACWLAEGERCPNLCRNGRDDTGARCDRCNLTGYLRPPAPLWWALSEPGPGTLPAWQSAALLHVSALRVAAGMGAVRGVYSAPEPHAGYAHYVHRRLIAGDGEPEMVPTLTNAALRWSAALAAGYALIDGDVLTIEVPDGEALAAGGGR